MQSHAATAKRDTSIAMMTAHVIQNGKRQENFRQPIMMSIEMSGKCEKD